MHTKYYKEDFLYPQSCVHFHLYNSDFPELHDHDYWEFFVVLSGEIRHTCDNSTQRLVAGNGCLIRPWNKHRFTAGNHTHLNLMITDAYFKQLLDIIDDKLYNSLTQVRHATVYDIDNSLLQDTMQTVHTLQTASGNDVDNFVSLVKLMWLDIIKLIYRSGLHINRDYPEWLNDFIKKMRAPENIPKPISQLCELAHFSYSHLARLFKQYTGETLNDYHRSLRLNYGAMLLRTTDMSILSISSLVGYDSLSHFMRAFKQLYRMTPKEYRIAQEVPPPESSHHT